ncbi:hypothetical protein ND860_18515 [Leptospira levettii]|uniref:hypothetical protein n=1 Tax=Leptospira levettii TaxID=2023178 RepID=UPI00223DC7FB|nr:hypothetical protein [Leptospira levettii]MCW7498535.1 hypothetical protein [Leptospira levettii]
MANQIGNTLTSEFIEEDLIAAFERVIGQKTYPKYFLEISRISQNEEKEKGYDGILNTLIPIYIQFKRSKFYLPTFAGDLKKGREKLQKPTDKGFYAFNLHPDDTGGFKQHNTLFTLNKNHKAIYIAPLFHKKSQLTKYKNLHPKFLYRYFDPFIYEHGHKYQFKSIPLFDHLVSIVPHKLVSSKGITHHYAFDKERNITFHSEPENPEIKILSLNEFFNSLIDSNEKNTINLESYISTVEEIFSRKINSTVLKKIFYYYYRRNGFSFYTGNSNLLNIKKLGILNFLFIFEQILEDFFGIKQYFLEINNDA